MRTYDELRQRKQLVTEAMALILAKEARRQKQIWLNLFCCRIKKLKPIDFSAESEESDNEEVEGEREEPSLRAKILFNLN